MIKTVLRRGGIFSLKEYISLRHFTSISNCRKFLLDVAANLNSNRTDVILRHSSIKFVSKSQNSNSTTYNNISQMEVSDLKDDYEISNKEIDQVKKCFQQPRNVLNNVAVKVKNHTKYDMINNPKFNKTNNELWACSNVINWPEVKNFVGYGRTKQIAANVCSMKILHYLIQMKKLNLKGEPIFYSKETAQALLKSKPVDISFPDNLLNEVRELNTVFVNEILPILNKLSYEENQNLDDHIDSEREYNKRYNKNVPYSKIIRRNLVLKERAQWLLEHQSSRELYPIYRYRNDLLNLLENNRVVVVKGEPGCGKSTQVPQYILDKASADGEGAECNMLITQPRRISAISLAHRISEERDERLGDSVGYQVRLKSCMPDRAGGTILFCSTGIALKRIQNDSNLSEFSHVIIDEAHERDADIDTLLLLVKRALDLNPKLKVIVMSATMDAELFAKYLDSCVVLNVPGFTYPVKMNFLDDIKRLVNLNKSLTNSSSETPKIYEDEVANMIMWIDKNRPPGAILCFLPGWSEIKKVQAHLEDATNSDMQILVAHSKLPTDVQSKIFLTPPEHIRKVILSTNICETSITINDIGYVVDCGIHRSKNILPSGLESMQSEWISEANVNQRKGRAGRVKSGESFHLFTKARYDMLHEYPVAEILRIPLEKIILDSKTYSYGENAREYLNQLIEPPPLERIDNAVNALKDMTALTENEQLTPLGRRIALFSLPPRLSKALIHSIVFRCFKPILTISTIYSMDVELAVQDSREETRNLKAKYDELSDHMAMAHLFDRWRQSNNFGSRIGLNNDKMYQVQQLRELHADNVRSCGMLEELHFDDEEAVCNEFAKDSELVKAVLFSGIASVCERRTHKIVNGVVKKSPHFKNRFDQIIQITSQSVLHERDTFPSRFVSYISELHSVERKRSLVSEASVISPLIVMLFNDSAVTFCDKTDLNDNINALKCNTAFRIEDFGIEFECDSRQVEDVARLRMAIWDTFQYYIEHQGKTDVDEAVAKTMYTFREKLVPLVSKLLNNMKYSK